MGVTGILDLTFWGYVGALLALTHVTIASVTIFLHRCQAHRGLHLHPVISHFFRFWLWLTTGMVTAEWVAVHRKHHARCEQAEDPHSPQQVGIARVLFAGTWLYRDAAADPDIIAGFSHGTPTDWIERNLYSRHRFVGIGLMLLIDLLLFGWVGPMIWIVQMIWIPFWAAGVINGVGHYWGYRNFETDDASRNIVPWGIVIGGEELHNNHHAYGVSARLSNKWWEFDIGWMYIRLLELSGLATVRRTAPKTSFAEVAPVTKDTLQAIVANRFHILKLYGTRVIRPVVRDECRRLSTSTSDRLKTAVRLLIREGLNHDEAQARELQGALHASADVKTIFEFKQRLKELWTQRINDQKELVTRLQAWCMDAEASGIAALEQFALEIRSYRSRLVYA